jgi:hypothetical protein
MNAPDHLPTSSLDPAEQGRIATLDRFKLEEFQHMTKEDLLLAQSTAGHGAEWGIWKTPKSISPGKISPTFRDIDLAQRLHSFLAKESEPGASQETLVGDGVLLLTRIALLLRLAPTGGQRKTKNRRLKPSTLAQHLFSYVPQILARAIRRKAKRPDAQRLFSCLTEEDLQELRQIKKLRIELERLGILAARGTHHQSTRSQTGAGTRENRG